MESCRTLEQFHARFPTEDACVDYLFRSKWSEGYVCPRCSCEHSYRIATRRLPLFECANCRHQTSLIAGTIMEGSRTSLLKWFFAVFLVSLTDQGISAVSLSRMIHVTYKTGWLILHKIRYCMSKAIENDRLSGLIHVNALCYGRPYNPSFLLHPQEQPLLAAATMNDSEEPVRIRISCVPKAHILDRAVQNHGTDAFIVQSVDASLTEQILCFTGRFLDLRQKKLLPVFQKTEQWMNQTFHGIGPKHLQAYLDEFSCRFNLWMENTPIMDRLVRQCATTRRITYPALISKSPINEFPAYQNGLLLKENFAPFFALRRFITRYSPSALLSAAS